MNKNTWLIANWKSNKTISEALDWISLVGPNVPRRDDLKIVICSTFSTLSEIKKAITVGNFPLMVGSQDLSPFGEGAYTGEEAAIFLKDLVELSIIGHSERRENFLESDELIARKVKQALQNNIIPLVCVQGSDALVPDSCKLIAYEPIFAIGTNNPDTPENANNVANALKKLYSFPNNEIEVLYGGSVTSENISSFLNQFSISGALIGKASLDAQEFLKIIQKCEG
jgi:triosephosphate isomerase (TIM)